MTAELDAIPRDCPRCKTSNFKDLGLGRDEWTIGKCTSCGFAYLTSAPTYEALSEKYAWEKSFQKEAKRRKKARPLFSWLDAKTRWRLHIFPRPETEKFLKKLVPTGNVVDIGCGSGGHVMQLVPGVTPYGVEISKSLAAEAETAFSSHGGYCVHAPSVEGLSTFEDNFFDGAMLNSYLEHETSPLEVLDGVRRVLKPDGIAVVKVPNFGSVNAMVMRSNWCGIRLPDHVNYFTETSLKEMANDVGLTASFPRLSNLPTNDNFWAFLRPAA